MKKRSILTFVEVEDCSFDLIQYHIEKMVGKEYNSPLVTFNTVDKEEDYISIDMMRSGKLVALITILKYNERQEFVIDYREVEQFLPDIKVNNN